MIDKAGTQRLHGMIAAAVTPFEQDEVRWDLFRNEIRYLLSAGVDGIGVAGSTGEGAGLDDAEIARGVAIAREEAGADVPIVGGVIRNSTREAVRTAAAAVEAGADALLVTPVFYTGGTPEDNEHYFRAVATAAAVPIVVYNVVPTNVIDAQTMLRLSDIDGVVGVKQVAPEGIVEMLDTCGDRTSVYSATDTMLYSTYVAGCVGAISAMIAVAPQLCVAQWSAYRNGDHATAAGIQRKLSPIARAYAPRPFPAKVKAFIALQGREVGACRAPLLPVPRDYIPAYRALLDRAGLLQPESST